MKLLSTPPAQTVKVIVTLFLAIVGVVYLGKRIDEHNASTARRQVPDLTTWAAAQMVANPLKSNRTPRRDRAVVDNEPLVVDTKLLSVDALYPEEDRRIMQNAWNRNIASFEMYVSPPWLFRLYKTIRRVENGRPGREFGILHPKAVDTNLDTQAGWAAATVIKNYTRFIDQGGDPQDCVGYLRFLANRYCPVGADNDPEGLNKHWYPNMLHHLQWYEDPISRR